MCTAIATRDNGFYFGRNMDLYYHLDFEVTEYPQNRPIIFQNGTKLSGHNGILGAAVITEGQPLYADGMNRHGLCIAGLDFPKCAYYPDEASEGSHSVAPFEVIPWVLTQCSSVAEAKMLMSNTCIINSSFNSKTPTTPMHWMLADSKESAVIEQTKSGMHIYDNAANTLTNSPEYPFHAVNLRQYANLSPYQPKCSGWKNKLEKPFSYGFGAIGLPGDMSSASRFVKAAFMVKNSSCKETSSDKISHFFRLLSAVSLPKGSVRTENGTLDVTVYASCMDAKNGVYYYVPYDFITAPIKTHSFTPPTDEGN